VTICIEQLKALNYFSIPSMIPFLADGTHQQRHHTGKHDRLSACNITTDSWQSLFGSFGPLERFTNPKSHLGIWFEQNGTRRQLKRRLTVQPKESSKTNPILGWISILPHTLLEVGNAFRVGDFRSRRIKKRKH